MLLVGAYKQLVLGHSEVKHVHISQDHQVIDAMRRTDNELVAIKTFPRNSQEVHIAQFLSNAEDKMNHAVPVFAILPDPFDPQLSLMVMPYLRPCNDPEFGTIGEVIEFINQLVEV